MWGNFSLNISHDIEKDPSQANQGHLWTCRFTEEQGSITITFFYFDVSSFVTLNLFKCR